MNAPSDQAEPVVDRAARWMARAVLTTLGVALLAALPFIHVHGANRLWPVVNSHDTVLGLLLVAAVFYMAIVCAVIYIIVCLFRAAK